MSTKGWSADWIWHPNLIGQEPCVLVFRRRFSLAQSESIVFHVSADQRYDLYLDGAFLSKGPELGDPLNWFYHSYRVELCPGDHVIVARVHWIGDMAPLAQMTVRGGFILYGEGSADAYLSTGKVEWEVARMDAYTFERSDLWWGVCACMTVDGTKLIPGFESGGGAGFVKASKMIEGAEPIKRAKVGDWWRLKPSTLPDMIHRRIGGAKVRHAETVESIDSLPEVREQHRSDALVDSLEDLVAGKEMVVPRNTSIRAILDMQDYYCVYPELRVLGGKGSRIRLLWAESLYHDSDEPRGPIYRDKGDRDEIEGKLFYGDGDTFLPDGRELRFDLLWWRSGRYIELLVETADEDLVLRSLDLYETRYPVRRVCFFSSSEQKLCDVVPIVLRTLEMCSHESYMDCPYYEQLQYIGDTHLDALATYAVSDDDRLVKKALTMFDASRCPEGLTQSRYPTREAQRIPAFSLYWVKMLHDFYMHRDDRAFVQGLVPGTRAVLDAFERHLGSDGLIRRPEGWGFQDWVRAWKIGVPSHTDDGVDGIMNLQYVMALEAAARLEEDLGRAALSSHYRSLAKQVREAVNAYLWDERQGLYAHDLGLRGFSEQMQALAIVTETAGARRSEKIRQRLSTGEGLDPSTIFASHYLFEAYYKLGMADRLLARMEPWFDHLKRGLRTLIEEPEPTRSDCHAWGTHLIYHYFASLLGIRPAQACFRSVRISPCMGLLTNICGSMPHPKGAVIVSLSQDKAGLSAEISLPLDVTGTFTWGDQIVELNAGSNSFSVQRQSAQGR